MLLYLLRHANADTVAESDDARTLSEKGLAQAKKVARFCEAHEIVPELILTSPLRRAHETALMVSAHLRKELVVEPWLASGMHPERALEELRAHRRHESAMIVGHEPDFSRFAAHVLGLPDEDRLVVRKGLAHAAGHRKFSPRRRAPPLFPAMPLDVTPRLFEVADFAADTARWIADEIRAAVAARGFCRLALSGGNTPRAVHRELARIELPWNHVQITFGDERCVPPDDADSNFRMARETLFDAVAIPAGNIFRIRGEIASETAAVEYDHQLAAVAARLGEARYVHDLLLLGLGEDGHTASLFPGSPALAEATRNIIPAIGPKPPPQRVTMTLPLLNAARHVAFLVQGAGKRPLVDEIASGRSTLPAALVRPADGKVTWVLGG